MSEFGAWLEGAILAMRIGVPDPADGRTWCVTQILVTRSAATSCALAIPGGRVQLQLAGALVTLAILDADAEDVWVEVVELDAAEPARVVGQADLTVGLTPSAAVAYSALRRLQYGPEAARMVAGAVVQST